MTETQMEAVRRTASTAGLSVASWARMVLLASSMPPAKGAPESWKHTTSLAATIAPRSIDTAAPDWEKNICVGVEQAAEVANKGSAGFVGSDGIFRKDGK